MKIKIALCDDDARALPVISGAAESVFRAHGIEPEIHCFQSGRELLRAMEDTRFQLLLLDIEMPGMDGIAVGRALRERDDTTKIVYVSEAESRVFESFLAQPFGFVRKSNFLSDISAVVELYIKASEQEQTDNCLELVTRSELLTLRTGQIRYIEGSRNYQRLYLEGKPEPLEVKMTMDHLERLTASHGFIRVHKGYLVNYQYIQRLASNQLTLQDGTELPIGQSKSEDVKRQYLSLIGRERR